MMTFTHRPIQEKKICVAQARIEPVHAFGSAWETLSLIIIPSAYLWLLYFVKDILAYNSTMKVSLKILDRMLYPLVFESYP